MKKILLIFLTGFLLILSGCEKDKDFTELTTVDQVEFGQAVFMEPNPNPALLGPLPAATVERVNYPMNSAVKMRNGEENSLLPSPLVATLKPGESITEHKTGTIVGAPPKGDIMFCMDLTGSMGGELNNVKANSCNIMDAIRGFIPDTRFGLLSHMDYPRAYNSCGYDKKYGESTDYACAFHLGLTTVKSDVETAINGLSLGNGWDSPEDYGRAFNDAVFMPGEDADLTNDWRVGAKKILIAWLDAVPHDCDYMAILGQTGYTTGIDPGRDAEVGTSDDLPILDVLDAMVANDITLISLYSGGSSTILSLWEAYAERTGGSAVEINSNGTIPGGMDIATFVKNLIEAEVTQLDEVKLEVITEGFEAWMTDCQPSNFIDVDLSSTQEFVFDITITVPPETSAGFYEFTIALVGDGAEYARQEVEITVITDTDEDGCNDDVDPHPESIIGGMVTIDGCNSGVDNVFVTDCSTMMDLLGDCAEDAVNHGDYVSCVAHLTNEWKSAGLISGKEKGKIQRCAAQADIP